MNNPYRHPPVFPARRRAGATLWPVAVALFYGAFAAAMIGFAVWSGRHREELVAPDYYARTVNHQGRIDAEIRARAIPVGVEVDAGARAVRLTAPAGLAAAAGAVRVEFYRPSRAALDFTRETAFSPTGSAVLELPSPLAPGLWRATVSWSMDHRDYLREYSLHIP